MAANKKSEGNTRTWANATGSTVLSGGVAVLASGATGHCAIASNDIANNTSGTVVDDGGVYELPAEAGTGLSWADDIQLYWDGTKAVAEASGNTRLGRAWGAKAALTAVANVKLHRT